MALLSITELDHIIYVKMNRPDVRNAFNPEMIEELKQTFLGFEKKKNIRAVVFSGEGKIFSAGADLNWMTAMVNYSFEQNKEDSSRLYDMFDAIWKCSLPVIGIVQGAAIGGALGLMACCDYVIIEEGTQLCFSEVKLGIVPAVISSFVLRKIPAGQVRFAMISGKTFSAEQALEMGLAHEKVPAGKSDVALVQILKTFKEAGPEAVRETKKLLNDLPHLDLLGKKERTTRLIAERRVSSEGQEGLKSFLDKRAPAWRDFE